MAEYYSVELSQKIKRGLNINAEKGLAIGGMKILGYKIEDKHYVIDENTAPVVKKIFDMYISGKTMADVIRYLNQIGAKTALGNEFNKNSIRRILTNKKYIGIYTYKGVEMSGNIPRIIDDKTFKQAVIRLQKTKKLLPEQKLNKKCIYFLPRYFAAIVIPALLVLVALQEIKLYISIINVVATERKNVL